MSKETQPFHTFSLTAGEAIEAGMACQIEADGTCKKLETDVSMFCGIAKFAAALGEAVTMQYGIVLAQVDGSGSAGAPLTVDATAGHLVDTATTTAAIVGYALEAWTADATIRCFIPSLSPSRLAIA